MHIKIARIVCGAMALVMSVAVPVASAQSINQNVNASLERASHQIIDLLRQMASVPSSATSSVPEFSIAGQGGGYTVGSPWTLTLAAGIPSTSFSICAEDNTGLVSCTPNWGTTDASGGWSQSGTFSASTLGSWTEWIIFPNGTPSNAIAFTVSQASGIVPPPPPPENPTSTPATSTIPSNLGVYIWGKQYDASQGNGPIVDPVAFAVSKGFHTVRLALSPRSSIDYGLSNACDSNLTLTQLAQGSQFAQAFANRAVTTFILTTYDHATFSDCTTPRFLSPSFYTAANSAAIEQEYQDLTVYLYRTYHDTGKTFIIDTWEGDNQIYCGDAYGYATNAATKSACDQGYAARYDGNASANDSIQGMKDWIIARIAGIAAGKAQAAAQGFGGVSVFSAAEFNMVHALHDRGYESVLYDVLPGLPLDYVSYSSYESINQANPGSMLAADIGTIEGVLGNHNLIIGEFGYSSDQVGASAANADLDQVASTIEQAGLSYGIIWQLFDQPQVNSNFGLFNDSGQSELYTAITEGPPAEQPPIDIAGAPPIQANLPALVQVTAASLHVRSAPNISAPLAGSRTLFAGDTFVASRAVQGSSIGGNAVWYVSGRGNYVWSGGVQMVAVTQ